MATWLTHIRIAQVVSEHFTCLQPGLLALGSVAPDSGAPAADGSQFSPPKEVTHYYRRDDSRYRINDVEFYCKYLTNTNLRVEDPEAYSFRMGYLCHLLTDHLWSTAVGRPTKKLCREQLRADYGFWNEIKRDWYGLDFEYLLSNPRWPFWGSFKGAVYERELIHHIPIRTLEDRQRSIVQFYECSMQEMRERAEGRPDRYLHAQQMDRFVRRAERILLDTIQSMPYDVCYGRKDGFRSLIQLHSPQVF